MSDIKHLGIILDGNRRYATSKGLPPWEGHRVGIKNGNKLISEWMVDLNIKELTLYLFSMQNFKRDPKEVRFLMTLFKEWLKSLDFKELKKKGIKVNFIGRIHLFSKEIHSSMKEIMEKTKDNDKHIVNLAMGYGGREEIVDAVKKIAKEVLEGKVNVDDVNIDLFNNYLYLQSEPDIIIRTGGARRTSNFLVWQSWYSEWFFTEKTWPEFTKADLVAVMKAFTKRERRFGK